MNDQKQKIKPIYKVMIFAIILTFVLALTVVPAFADEPQITNLIGTTWRLDGFSISGLAAEYGIFNVNLDGSLTMVQTGENGGSVTVDGIYTNSIACGYFPDLETQGATVMGYANSVSVYVTLEGDVPSWNPLNMFLTGAGFDMYFIYEFTITGGDDISNPLFIDFINTYGTLVSDGEEVTTPTIYDIWDDILEWMVNAAENMTSAFYYNEQLTLLGILCVIPLSLGLVILIVKILEEWISLR